MQFERFLSYSFVQNISCCYLSRITLFASIQYLITTHTHTHTHASHILVVCMFALLYVFYSFLLSFMIPWAALIFPITYIYVWHHELKSNNLKKYCNNIFSILFASISDYFTQNMNEKKNKTEIHVNQWRVFVFDEFVRLTNPQFIFSFFFFIYFWDRFSTLNLISSGCGIHTIVNADTFSALRCFYLMFSLSLAFFTILIYRKLFVFLFNFICHTIRERNLLWFLLCWRLFNEKTI